MLIAYDIDIADADGYGWLLEAIPDDPYEWDDYGIHEATSGGDTLVVLEYDEGAVADSVLTAHVRDLLTAGSSFLTLRSGPYNGRQQLQQAGIDLGGTLVKLTDAVEFIRAEDDTAAGGQDDDVIPLGWLTDLDEGIAGMSDAANFTSNWESIEDVLAWLEELRTGPYRFQETIVHEVWDEDLEDWVEVPMDIDVTLDLSVMLTNPVGDWKTKLPYHSWLAPETWIVREAGEPWYTATDPDSPYIVSILDEPMVFTGIGVIEHIVVDADMGQTMVMLDGSGGDAIGEGEFPYFPDYTFGGLFPGMDRPGWIELIEALEGPDR
jgi:hypothetical protein